MAIYRISVPLYVKRLHEQGMSLSPTPADIPQETIHLWHYDLYPLGRKHNKRYEYSGHQYFVIPPDIPQETIHLQEFENPPFPKKFNRRLFEYWGWNQQPLSADGVIITLNERKDWTDLPPIGLRFNRKFDYKGYQYYIIPDDIPQETIEQVFENPVIKEKKKKYEFVGWFQSPLSSDIPQETINQQTENPTTKDKRKKYSYEGWNSSPLSADIAQETINLIADELYPYGKKFNKRYSYEGQQQSPLSADIPQETLHLQHTDNPPIGRKFTLKSQGWTQSPLSDDIPQETIHLQETPDKTPYRKSRHTFVGFQQQPLSANQEEDIINRFIYDVPRGKNRKETVHWEDKPLAADVPQETIHLQEFTNPQLKKKSLFKYIDWTQSPLSVNAVSQMASLVIEMPDYIDDFNYHIDEFSGVGPGSPMSARLQEFPTYLFPRSKKREIFHFEAAPLAADIPQETVSQRFDNPQLRRKNLLKHQDWIQIPLSADIPQETVNHVVDVLAPRAKKRLSYEGWQQQPLSANAAEPLIGAYHYDVPIGHSKAYRQSWLPSQSQATVLPDASTGHKPRLTVLGCGH